MRGRPFILMLGAAVLLSACNHTPSTEADGAGANSGDSAGAPNPDQDRFLAVNRLLVAHGCSNCHASDYARVGPALRDVAMVHENATAADRQMLRDSILNGVKGKWGTAIMPPQHQVTPQQASEIVAAVLALKGSPEK